jgi:hypothetical protein
METAGLDPIVNSAAALTGNIAGSVDFYEFSLLLTFVAIIYEHGGPPGLKIYFWVADDKSTHGRKHKRAQTKQAPE